LNSTRNVREEETPINAIIVRSDGKRVPKLVIKRGVTIGTSGMEVRTKMVLEDQKWRELVIPQQG